MRNPLTIREACAAALRRFDQQVEQGATEAQAVLRTANQVGVEPNRIEWLVRQRQIERGELSPIVPDTFPEDWA